MTVTLAAVTAACLLTAAYLLLSRRRGIPRLRTDFDGITDISSALPQIAGLTGGFVQDGNRATLYQDGELLEGLKDAIRGANSTVHLETYVWVSGTTEEEFTALLCRKAREGVAVRLLLDALGAKDASESRIKALRHAGVRVGYYHPINRFSIRRFNNRTHRKLLIVDGKTAFTFGHGISDPWRGRGQDEAHWRDTGVALRGPLVCSLQAVFSQDWIEVTGSPPLEAGCFLRGDQEGSVAGHLVSSSSRDGYSSVALLYMLAMASARRRIIIQNPYFAPDDAIIELLGKVVARGVVVRLMVPGKYSDSLIVRRAGQRLYSRLLRKGVQLYTYDKTFLHQKIVVVDGIWSHIGSTNFDARSLALNAEIGSGLLDESIASQLEEAFDRDASEAHKLALEDWNNRPRHEKLLDWGAYQLHRQI